MRWLFAVLAICVASAARAEDPGYPAARAAFASTQTLDQRALTQILLTAAGYNFIIPQEDLSQRLFRSIRQFQADNGFPQDGILDKDELKTLVDKAYVWMGPWGMGYHAHPTTGVKILFPLGLDLTSKPSKWGFEFDSTTHPVSGSFNYFPNTTADAGFAGLLQAIREQGGKIYYQTGKPTWYAVSFEKANGTSAYVRYHNHGSGLLGFSLFWNSKAEDLHIERVAVIMSASISARLLGTPMTSLFDTDPPKGSGGVPPSTGVSVSPPPKAAPSAGRDGDGGSGQAETVLSSGTGFSVSTAGHVVTNVHVVEGCSSAMVRKDGETARPAEILARDVRNDIALLRSEVNAPPLPLRFGVKLGENVAAFGFPHLGTMSSSGNFTTGNITSLAGLRDDTSMLTMSAPVQEGNSGGPLVDFSGAVVGIVQSKLGLKMASLSGDLPQNVNFAIKAPILASFLDANAVTYEVAGERKELTPVDLAELARNASVLVVCESTRTK